MDTPNYLFAFSLTLFAGLSTGIGSLISLIIGRESIRFLAVALGLSAGVMIYVSFMEILPEAQATLVQAFGEGTGQWAAIGAFFAGMLLIALIDRLIPKDVNPHEIIHHPDETMDATVEARELNEKGGAGLVRDYTALKRTGMFTAIAIAIHNFPEGMATFTAALADPSLGIAIAIAIAIHNIPEGIAVAVPIYYATGSRKKAFAHSFLSGLAEPLGALLGFTLLRPFFSPALMGILFGVVAGIMVFISLDELLPSAEEYGEHHLSIYGLIAGMAIMAVSLLVLR